MCHDIKLCLNVFFQVLSIGMKDLKEISKMIKKKNEENGHGGCALHRTDSLYSAKNALEQVRFFFKQK